jgi:hypothetical protein
MRAVKAKAGVANNEDGRVSFHSARHSFHTEGRRVGISAEQLHALTRHVADRRNV